MTVLHGRIIFTGFRFFASQGWYPEVDTLSWNDKRASVALLPIAARSIHVKGNSSGRVVTHNGTQRRVKGDGHKRNVS